MFGISFKELSTLDVINTQIICAERALIENQGTAEHYQALADGNRKTLLRLNAMKQKELEARAPAANDSEIDVAPAKAGKIAKLR